MSKLPKYFPLHSIWHRFVNSVSILSSDSDSNSDNMLWVMFHVDFPKMSPFPFITHERNSEPVFHLPHAAVVGRRRSSISDSERYKW